MNARPLLPPPGGPRAAIAREISVAPRAGANRKDEGGFVEGLRNLIRSQCSGRFGDLALASGVDVGSVYEQLQGRHRLSPRLIQGAILVADREQLLLIAEYLFQGTPLAFALPPAAALVPSPTVAVASALPLVAAASEATALAQADGVVTASEAEVICESIESATALLARGRKSVRVAAGMELANG